MCSGLSTAIQNGCDSGVRLNTSQLANDLDKLTIGCKAMMPGTYLRKLQLGVISALPVQHKTDRFAFRGCNDLSQRNTQQAFFVFGRALRMFPEPWQVARNIQQFALLLICQRESPGLVQRCQLGF